MTKSSFMAKINRKFCPYICLERLGKTTPELQFSQCQMTKYFANTKERDGLFAWPNRGFRAHLELSMQQLQSCASTSVIFTIENRKLPPAHCRN
jgi:hypothetical protein